MTSPLVGMSGNRPAGCHHRQAEPPAGSQYGVTRWSGAKLGVEIGWPAESKNLLEKADVAREKHEPAAVPGKDVRQRRCSASWFLLLWSVSCRAVAVPVD